MSENQMRLVVIGAGYAGLLAAVRLAGKTRRQPVEITLVNASEMFIERLRLHQYAANQANVQRPIQQALAGTAVVFVRGWVTALNVQQHEIVVQTQAGERRVAYDKLVYALGSTIDRDSIPGVREHAYTLTPSGALSAEALKNVLPALAEKGGRLVVVGGGATGIEAAAEFVSNYPLLQVSLVTQGVFGAFTTPKVAAYMRKSLTRQHVAIHDQTKVREVGANEAVTDAGKIPFDVCLWAGGFSVPAIAREAGLAVNERGQIEVDPFLRSTSHPDIYAIGDAAHPVQQPGAPLRMAALAAVIMGAYMADSLSAVVKGKTPRPFGFSWLGQGIALGKGDAVGFNNFPNDRQWGPIFTGRVGMEIRDFFVRFLAALPRIERRWPGIFYWLGKGRGKQYARPLAQRADVHVMKKV